MMVFDFIFFFFRFFFFSKKTKIKFHCCFFFLAAFTIPLTEDFRLLRGFKVKQDGALIEVMVKQVSTIAKCEIQKRKPM